MSNIISDHETYITEKYITEIDISETGISKSNIKKSKVKWFPIIKTLLELGEKDAIIWYYDFIANDDGSNICGIRGQIKGFNYSIISHKYSYGGEQDLFEVMPGIGEESNDVTGWLTVEQVIAYLKSFPQNIMS